MVDTTSVIDTERLGRRFGRTEAIQGLDLRVCAGEIFGLVGADGAGKTTLLQLLAAILDPSDGRCRVLGFDTVRQAPQVTSRIGYMAQGFTLYDRLTVAENLAFAARVRGVSPADYARRSERLLAMAGLSRVLHRREGALSGGMRKKLALCANLIHEPPLLLLDEPGLGVDPLSRRELWRMLEAFRSKGSTIVFSTSYMDEAERGDRVLLLDRGRIVALGTPGELRSRAAGSVFRVSTQRPGEAERVLGLARGIVGLRRQAGALHVVVGPESGPAHETKDRLAGLGCVEPVAPSMEDAFLVLRAGSGGGELDRPSELPVASPAHPVPEGRAIHTERLTRRFDGFAAVDAVSIEVRSGEIFGLLGANGAGKTTLIRMLCGLLPPSEGRAHVAGFDIASEPHRLRARIGYMSQRFSLYSDLTAAENLAFFAHAYGLDRRRRRAAIDWARGVTGLDDAPERPAGRLSGAVRQRLALACSILHRPAVLFLDEPTSGVDPEARARFWRLIDALADAGAAVLVTTHYLAEAAFCHRLGLMHDGRLIASGDLAALRAGLGAAAPQSAEEIFLAHIRLAQARAEQSAALS